MHCRQLTHGNILTYLIHWIRNVSMDPWVSWWLKPSCDHVIFRVSKIWRRIELWNSELNRGRKVSIFNMKTEVSFVKQKRHISDQVKLCLQYTTHWGKGFNLKKRYLINCIKFERTIWYQLHFAKMKINKLPQRLFYHSTLHKCIYATKRNQSKNKRWVFE